MMPSSLPDYIYLPDRYFPICAGFGNFAAGKASVYPDFWKIRSVVHIIELEI